MQKFLTTVAAMAILGLSAPMVMAENLADALTAAYRTSHLLEQNRALLRAADEDVAAAVGSLRPVVSFATQTKWLNPTGSSQPSPIYTTYSLSAELTILDFGRGKHAVEAAKATVMATQQSLIGVESSVLLQALTAYVNVRLAQDTVGLRQNNVKVIEQELQAAKDRFEVGEVTKTDVAAAEARLAAAQSTLAAAQGDLKVAREAYKAATGAYPGTLAPLPKDPATAKSVAEAEAIALRSQWALKQAQYSVSAADANVARAAAATRPSLGISATSAITQDGTDANTASLTFSQTLYAGGQLSAAYRRALASKDAARAALGTTTVQISQNVQNAWTQVEVYSAAIEAGNLQVTAAQTAFDGVREEAKLGARTTLDVLDAEQELLSAKVAKVQAEAERHIGVYQLLSAMGLLTVDHLGLGIPTYDAEAYYNAVKSAPATSTRGAALDRVLSKIGKN